MKEYSPVRWTAEHERSRPRLGAPKHYFAGSDSLLICTDSVDEISWSQLYTWIVFLVTKELFPSFISSSHFQYYLCSSEVFFVCFCSLNGLIAQLFFHEAFCGLICIFLESATYALTNLPMQWPSFDIFENRSCFNAHIYKEILFVYIFMSLIDRSWLCFGWGAISCDSVCCGILILGRSPLSFNITIWINYIEESMLLLNPFVQHNRASAKLFQLFFSHILVA